MENNPEMINTADIRNRIFTIRGVQVMLDRDLAKLYQVETKVLNQAVKRNKDRFPEDFMFQMTNEEFENWRSQFVTSKSDKMGLRRPPYVFSEQGVSMLSAVLKSKTAVYISLKIIRAFVKMRKFLSENASIFQRLDKIEHKQIEADTKFEQIFKAIEEKEINPKQGIFFDGQIFDAYKFVSDLFRSAKSSIQIIDNYIDDSVLTHLTKKEKNVSVTIYTKNLTKQLKLDIEKFNKQYNNISLVKFNKSHDRFVIIDQKSVYHFGASLKDLGKKWFAFSKFDKDAFSMIDKL